MMRAGLVTLMCCLLLVGCGTKFVYNNMDWLLIEYLEDYVDLNSDQESLIEQRVALLSEWHRSEEIPNYVEHLDELMTLDLKNLTAAQLNAQEEKLRAHTDRIVKRVAPDLAQLIHKLSDEQVDELMDNIRVRHSKYKAKYSQLNEEEVRQVYAERIAESMENWLGRLTKDQERLVEQWSNDLQITTSDWSDHQTNLRIRISQLLNQRSDLNATEREMNTLLVDSESLYSPMLRRKIEHNRDVATRYIVEIATQASDKQIEHYRKELSDWKEIALAIQ
ncbi:hypothetical protein SE23_05135 [Vibrio sinaloensis]|uniref:DUF6279 family lipoprotein n=1 Tax=Photobacterium sp. (strain ATCC 43367) TaxID=379097 RepID=UPI00057C73A8|nr:DUF6279 family lipoprotein [Vibrio sinaloensis]KIE21604.1 hypothetical protein SE23_05135 [Vibrio sinaloensis]